jgi:cytochrome b561
MTPPLRYPFPARLLHWLMALLIMAGLALGYYLTSLPDAADKLALIATHKSNGVAVLLLAFVRLGWRMGNPPPPPPDSALWWERAIARAVHLQLYLLMIALPLSGWLMSSAKGYSVVFLGLVTLPDLVAADPALFDTLKGAHEQLAFVTVVLIALHLAGVVKHQLLDKDALLARMR